MPEYLYKFVSLKDEWIDGAKSREKVQMNENKLCALRQNKIWFSTPEYLNDPYEFKGFDVDYDQLKDAGISKEEVDNMQHLFEDDSVLSSFTLSMEDNFPMRAHYANNHRGYCIKYKVVDPVYIRKVRYATQRQMRTEGIRKVIQVSHDLQNREIAGRKKRLYMALQKQYMRILAQNYTVKHKAWSYDEEYRIITERKDKNNPYGRYVQADQAGLLTDAIFTGCKCERQESIQAIDDSLGVSCRQCHPDKKEFLIYAV